MAARPLTQNEIRLARSVFGDSLDYDRVTVSPDPWKKFLHPKGTAMAPDGRLHMYGCYAEDYAAAGGHASALFIHEMTHVWQYQNKVLNPVLSAVTLSLKHRFDYSAAYPFTLEPGRDLLSYGMEQQASIVEGYFMLRENIGRLSRCRNACGPAEERALYENVLARFLAAPSYARPGTKPPGPGA